MPGTAEPHILRDVQQLAHETLGPYAVECYLFGSWAVGRPRQTSDIDLAIDARVPLPPGLLATLRERFEESHIPYRVDVVDLMTASASLRDHVLSHGVRWNV